MIGALLYLSTDMEIPCVVIDRWYPESLYQYYRTTETIGLTCQFEIFKLL